MQTIYLHQTLLYGGGQHGRDLSICGNLTIAFLMTNTLCDYWILLLSSEINEVVLSHL